MFLIVKIFRMGGREGRVVSGLERLVELEFWDVVSFGEENGVVCEWLVEF